MSIALPPIADLCFIGVNNLCYILIMPGQRFFTPNVGMGLLERETYLFEALAHDVSTSLVALNKSDTQDFEGD